jgi:type II secretory ATPase GspE/PulE/Tfp pilus assembly ATPase PilB-like protein
MGSLFREGSLGAILYTSRIITEKDIETALEEQKRTGLRFGEALVSLGIVMQEDIDWALSNQLDIPYVRIRKETVDPAAVQLVPANIARKFNLLPLIRTGDELRIAIADPLDKEAVTEVERVSGCAVSISKGLLREIREMQTHFYGEAAETVLLGFSSSYFSAAVLETINNDITGAKLLDFLLRYMLQKGIASLSFQPLHEKVTVTGRQGGASRTIGTMPCAHYDGFLSLIKDRAGISCGDGEADSASLSLDMKGERVEFQVAMMQAGSRTFVTFKPFVSGIYAKSIAALETSERNRQLLRALASVPEGMVLFSAIDGEERVRLMAALLDECRRSGRDALLLGKGFSFCSGVFPVVPFSRCDPDTGNWIRAALAHEPAVVAVEELADSAAISAAIDSVLNGKLLFGGMPVPDLREMLRQLFFLRERHPVLPMHLRGIVASRGVRLLCPACREETRSSVPKITLPLEKTPPVFFKRKGCPVCRYTGYSGKRYLVEAAAFDGELAEMFNGSKSVGDLMRGLVQSGFHGISEEAAALLHSGEITAEEFASVRTDNGERLWPE